MNINENENKELVAEMKAFITNQIYDLVHLDHDTAQEEGDEEEIENAKKALKILRKLWRLNRITEEDAIWFKERFTY